MNYEYGRFEAKVKINTQKACWTFSQAEDAKRTLLEISIFILAFLTYQVTLLQIIPRANCRNITTNISGITNKIIKYFSYLSLPEAEVSIYTHLSMPF
jgi:hypothetical protein